MKKRLLKSVVSETHGYEERPESLKDEVSHIEQEARMVLPGIQALFGFQLIAVFNDNFQTMLSYNERILHWAAIAMSALATLLVIAPAAYHRQAETRTLSTTFANLASFWLTLALLPLALGICVDVFLIGNVITHDRFVSGIVSLVLLAGFLGLWFVFPLVVRRSRQPKA